MFVPSMKYGVPSIIPFACDLDCKPPFAVYWVSTVVEASDVAVPPAGSVLSGLGLIWAMIPDGIHCAKLVDKA
jgi:hypothetical protein